MPADRWVGQVLGGRYQIEELLGQGGMSAVYKAYDPNLRRTVAIKLIHPHLSDNEEFVRRFESEATAIARLRHANIVQVFDFNHDGDLYYMVLEFVAGETLQARIKRMNAAGRHMPIRDVLRYLIDVCKAADYAHQRGMIHRDIKPANVMLDVNGSAILMDFGIARILGGQHQTATGAVLGTALYMSPEQIQGLHPDARADIYSIGVTLFEALGGRPPFEADSAMTLMMMHLHDPVPDINQLHPGIPEAVRAIVNRALEKDRLDRYQSCAEMAAALEQALPLVGEEKVTAPRPSVPVAPPAPAKAPEQAPAEKPAEKPVEAPARRRAKPAAQPKPVPEKEPAPERAPVQETLVEPVSKPVPVPKPEPVPERQPAPAPMETIVEAPPVIPPRKEAASAVPVGAQPAAESVVAPPVHLPTHRRIPVPGIVAAALLVLAVGVFLLFRLLSPPATPAAPTNVPLVSVLATATVEAAIATPAPSATFTLEPTATLTFTPEPTPTETVAVAPVVGGADMLAFVFNKDIWIANIDGSDARQLTGDGTLKNDLRWLPGGEALSYISGKCLQTVDLQGNVAVITCFNNATYFDSFEVSPDGTRVALSLDRQLYLLPFDLERLAQADSHPDLVAMADCKELAPYQRSAVLETRWSKDGAQLAAVVLGVLADGRRGEVVHLFAVDRCIANPLVQVQFPEPHFTFGEYKSDPELPGLAWDGESLFVINGLTRNEGFGNLHIFNRETFKATTNADPIDGVCCYRNPEFSPDGKYLLFAFQDITLGANSRTLVYYIPFGTLGTGAKYQPLPLPEYSDSKEAPQAVLRPAK